MTTLADQIKEYRLRARLLREAPVTISVPDQRKTALELAEQWLALAEKTEAGLRYIRSVTPARQGGFEHPYVRGSKDSFSLSNRSMEQKLLHSRKIISLFQLSIDTGLPTYVTRSHHSPM